MCNLSAMELNIYKRISDIRIGIIKIYIHAKNGIIKNNFFMIYEGNIATASDRVYSMINGANEDKIRKEIRTCYEWDTEIGEDQNHWKTVENFVRHLSNQGSLDTIEIILN